MNHVSVYINKDNQRKVIKGTLESIKLNYLLLFGVHLYYLLYTSFIIPGIITWLFNI